MIHQGIHSISAGSGQTIVFLHGFPEHATMWEAQLSYFQYSHHVIAIDLPGYNLSDKPTNINEYTIPKISNRIIKWVQAQHLKNIILVGHDWGGMIAWHIAHTYPELLKQLVIINSPHPVIFEQLIQHNHMQQAASAYISFLRSSTATQVLSQNNFRWLWRLLENHQLLSTKQQASYTKAWQQPGCVKGMLNYYTAIYLNTKNDEPLWETLAFPDININTKTHVPIDVIWGLDDRYLIPENLDNMDHFAPNITIHQLNDIGHFAVHEYSQINQLLEKIIS